MSEVESVALVFELLVEFAVALELEPSIEFERVALEFEP